MSFASQNKPMRIHKTTAFRWALVYFLLFSISVSAVLGFVYWNTSVLIQDRMQADIERESKALLKLYGNGGPSRLLERLGELVSGAGEGLYLLTDFTGRPIIGNLPNLPQVEKSAGGWSNFTYERKTPDGFEAREARARINILTGGFRLLVGRDIQQLRRFQLKMQQILGAALLLSLLLGVGGGIFMSRNMLRRIESINRTARAIMKGDMERRIPVKGSGDEIDTLAQNLNAMLEQIATLMRGISEVSDNIAHDLKTPLTRLQARLEDASRSPDIDTPTRKALESSIKDARNLIETFNALLRIARTEAGQGLFEELDVSALIADVIELYEPVAAQSNIELVQNIAPATRAVLDRQLISQSIANLLDNAIKYAGSDQEKPRISIGLARTGDKITISICDNGPGIALSEREHVLERFVRLETSRSRPGSGLGLSLVAATARAHKGTLELKDNSPGLCAVLSLPVK